jgi:prepilin-type N-terminal cleavage/methylation domain-containing protein
MSTKKQGFTLLEMSIVITIIAILAGGGVAVFMVSLQRYQLQETYDKIHAIQQALYQYRIAFNRLPCPADISLSTDTQNFGVEAENQEDCDGTPSANFHGDTGTEQPHEGMVPTKTLKLSDDYAFDGWGRRLIYTVTSDMTLDSAFTTIDADDTTTRLTVNDGAGNIKSELAGYVILSTGANGHGGFPRVGGTTRINASSINTDELENCDCSTALVPSGLNGVFTQRDPSVAFIVSRNICDDIVVYGTRNDLRAVNE